MLKTSLHVPAGALAQSKTIAEEKDGKVLLFVTNTNLDGLLNILLKENRSGQDVLWKNSYADA